MSDHNTMEIRLCPTLPAAAPGDPDCSHKPEWQLVTGGRIVGSGATSGIATDATLCLRCGLAHCLQAPFRHWPDVVARFWREYGWHKTIGPRLVEFAEAAAGGPGFGAAIILKGERPEGV